MTYEGGVALRVSEPSEHAGAQQAGVFLAGRTGGGSAPERPVSRAVFHCRGEFWEIAFAGKSRLLRDRKGLRYLAVLLRHPWEELHVIELTMAAVSAGDAVTPATPRRPRRDLGALLDPQARTAYRGRLRELHTELEAAHAAHDPGRVARAQHEIEFVTRELARAVGLGGRRRPVGSATELARVNVSRAITGALKCIMEHHPMLGHHLVTTIRTGTHCVYAPNPRNPIEWTL